MKHKPLKQKYMEDVRQKLGEELKVANVMALPQITKIVVNMGTGERLRDKNAKEKLMAELAAITGQKPKVQVAKTSIAGFGVREGMPVGLTVTLRGAKMYDFLERLISVVLPRLRDFRGLPNKSFDMAGNYTLGVAEHTVFPEVDLARVDRPHGLELTIVIKNSDPVKSKLMLEMLGMPFEKTE
ncbi:50S ribosomal protein L5 [Candidatus Woesebacteria bacterium RIFCSPHIGHO2_01_FULL_44_21]|uniref:Large ribosomal subunit protein uL5 n=1 Tax=Candidatus Woesebacteria bacterium RIFCSPHIGHO2_01_FULL_44_21 TaxID=1802503 RepID=A0A1F7Z2T3_9BACT|nr:MAG: 50S ribosomal protein L5 [Candidatus Woesebacteria bacterium RIFCSPHIGHO2_01_FULL_44_21]OGM71476.1 MAG: 50S ribosomal protein L5 [Candidatus Woesebacteria bacterium RIFCSPLOWO2_01_FULL_44_24b]